MTEQKAQRIVFVATDLSTGGGVNRVIRDLAGLFADRLGADVTVLAARSRGAPTYRFADQVKLQLNDAPTIFEYIRALWRLRRSRPDVVIGSWTQDNLLLLAMFLFSRTRVIVCEHCSWNFHGRIVRGLRRLFYPLGERVIVLNPIELAHYSRWLANVELIPNPVALAAPSGDKREKLVLAIGHLSPVKNFADAIHAMSLSALEQDGWRLCIVGAGPQQGALQSLAGAEGLQAFSIERPVPDLASWYARAWMLLVPSTTEVFSLVLAEAMAAGLTPIAYATDGPSYLLERFPDLLVPVGDVEAMAGKMRAVADGGNGRGDTLRASIESRFAPDLIAERWRQVLA